MRIKEDFILRTVAGNHVVVPVGTQNLNFRGMITLNGTGAFLWEQLKEERSEEELLAALLSEYEVDEATAKAGIEAFIAKLQEADLLA